MNDVAVPGLDLAPQQLDIVRNILARVIPEREVWAFGSRVRGNAQPYSDLDLAVMDEQPLPLSVAAELAEAFDASDLTIKVDVVDWASASDEFRKIITLHKIVLRTGR